MKRLLIALTLVCAFAIQSMAQVEFHWGFKGGINFTTYNCDADDFQARMGQWGALCRWQLNDHWAIQPEVFYARMGVRSLEKKFADKTNEISYVTNQRQSRQVFKLHLLTDNIQVPVLVKYYLPALGNLGTGFNLHVGPLFSQRFDYKISASASELGYLLDGTMNSEHAGRGGQGVGRLRYIAQGMNQFTIHGVAGFGYDSPSGIGVDVRFQRGITPVWKKNHRGNYMPSARDQLVSISFNYTF